MKKRTIILVLIALFVPILASAQTEIENNEEMQIIVVPPRDGLLLSYQGVLHDAKGVPVEDDIYQMAFGIFEEPEGGTAVWAELQSVAVQNGVFSVYLGVENAMILPFDRQYYLGVIVGGGDGQELMPRKRMIPVPYSYYASTVLDGAISESKIRDDAVTTQKIRNGAVTAAKLAEDLKFTNYTSFENLAFGIVTVTSSWTKLNMRKISFVKQHDGSNIEIFLGSRAKSGFFDKGVNWIRYQLRVNGVEADHSNIHMIFQTNTIEYANLMAVYESLPAGTHTVEVWARTNGFSSSEVQMDPGGYAGSIIVKETF